MTAGIYCIENLVNGKKYIGQSINIKKRMFDEHSRCHALNNAIEKYGKENFKRYILLYCEPKELEYYEIACIKIFHSRVSESGYNIFGGGKATKTGWRHSEEAKRKISKTNLGKHMPDESKQKMSEAKLGEKNPMFGKHPANFGKHPSNKTRKKLSESHKGKYPSNKTREKLSKAHFGKRSPNFGKHLSEKTKKLISKNNAKFWQGKHLSKETKRKMSETKRKRNKK